MDKGFNIYFFLWCDTASKYHILKPLYILLIRNTYNSHFMPLQWCDDTPTVVEKPTVVHDI